VLFYIRLGPTKENLWGNRRLLGARFMDTIPSYHLQTKCITAWMSVTENHALDQTRVISLEASNLQHWRNEMFDKLIKKMENLYEKSMAITWSQSNDDFRGCECFFGVKMKWRGMHLYASAVVWWWICPTLLWSIVDPFEKFHKSLHITYLLLLFYQSVKQTAITPI